MAASMNCGGPLKGSFRAPSKGFGVDKGLELILIRTMWLFL